MTRVRIETIGCRLNIGEMEALARSLAGHGCRLVSSSEQADVCVFNTCTVTSIAAKKSRQILRQLRKKNPTAVIVATGCYAEMEPAAIAALGVDLIVGNEDKDHLGSILEARGLLKEDHEPAVTVSNVGPESERRTRAFLKVQDGCDNACTFCIVTVARGAGRSRTRESIVDEIDGLLDAGYKEIVLSGVHLGSYGHDLGQRRGLQGLVEHILGRNRVPPRLRLSSIEPWDLGPGFFDLLTDQHLQPHLHLPLQSGCDATLRRMARKTTRDEFADLVACARQRVPDVAISTDVMVGFPGETDADFDSSLEFVRAMEFSHLHVFRYSPRPGTRAATMPDQVPAHVANERSRRLHVVNAAAEAAFASRFSGRRLDVLWEAEEEYGDGLRWTGLTPHAVRAVTETPAGVDLHNRITPATITGPFPGGVLAAVDGSSVANLIEPSSRRLPTIVTSQRRDL